MWELHRAFAYDQTIGERAKECGKFGQQHDDEILDLYGTCETKQWMYVM